jgi:hypothetical protein
LSNGTPPNLFSPPQSPGATDGADVVSAAAFSPHNDDVVAAVGFADSSFFCVPKSEGTAAAVVVVDSGFFSAVVVSSFFSTPSEAIDGVLVPNTGTAGIVVVDGVDVVDGNTAAVVALRFSDGCETDDAVCWN